MEATNTYLTSQSNKTSSSVYNIGSIDGSISNFLLIAPKALSVSIFGPYLWEIRNPFMLLSGLESFIFLFLTLKIFKFKNLKIIYKNPILIFCAIFFIIFGVSIGIATANYGSLVRYKVPLIPFLWTFLIVLNYQTDLNKSR